MDEKAMLLTRRRSVATRVLAGRFEIESLLGRGGMGAVYRARDRVLDRFVAVKLLVPELASGVGVVDRFLREARLSARLEHAHIVRVHEVGCCEGELYLAMELVEGVELGTWFSGEGRTRCEGLRLLSEVAEALAYAHDRGIIHRDLKPGNVLVTHEGTARVVDWGLARSMADPSGLTRTGILLGTPGYMAPEQILDRAVGPATDLFALGCMLHLFLYGRPPFTGKDLSALLGATIRGSQDLDLAPRADLDPSSVALLRALLDGDETRRPNRAAEVALRLRSFAERSSRGATVERTRALSPPRSPASPRTVSLDRGGSSPPVDSGPVRPWRWVLIGGSVLLALFAVVGIVPFSRRAVPDSVELPEGRRWKELRAGENFARATLRFSGPRGGRVRIRFCDEEGRSRTRPRSVELDLASARIVSQQDALAVVSLDPPPWSKTWLHVEDGTTVHRFPLDGAERLLEPIDRLRGEALLAWLRAVTAVRPLLTAWERASSSGSSTERLALERQIDERWQALPVGALSMAYFKLLRGHLEGVPPKLLRPQGPLARRLLPLRWAEGLLGTGGYTPSPWGAVTALLGFATAQGGRIEPNSDAAAKGWTLFRSVDFYRDHGRGMQCLWLNPRSARVAPKGEIDYPLVQKLASAAATLMTKGSRLEGETIRDLAFAPQFHTWSFHLDRIPKAVLLVVVCRFFPHNHSLRVEVNGGEPIEIIETMRFLAPELRGSLEMHRWFVPLEVAMLRRGENRIVLSDDGTPGNDRPMDIVALKGLALWAR